MSGFSNVGSFTAASALLWLALMSEVFASSYLYAAHLKKKKSEKKSFSLIFYKPLYYANSETSVHSRLLCSLPSSPTERLVASCLIMNGLQKAHFTVLWSDSYHTAALTIRTGYWSHMAQYYSVTHFILYLVLGSDSYRTVRGAEWHCTGRKAGLNRDDSPWSALNSDSRTVSYWFRLLRFTSDCTMPASGCSGRAGAAAAAPPPCELGSSAKRSSSSREKY